MEFGGWSGITDDSSKESMLTRELMDNYTTNKFEQSANLMADDGNFYFNSNKVSKEEWVGAAALHHSLFDDISNSKIQPTNVTTATYDNGSVWSMAWFYWTATGKITGNEIQIPVHQSGLSFNPAISMTREQFHSLQGDQYFLSTEFSQPFQYLF